MSRESEVDAEDFVEGSETPIEALLRAKRVLLSPSSFGVERFAIALAFQDGVKLDVAIELLDLHREELGLLPVMHGNESVH